MGEFFMAIGIIFLAAFVFVAWLVVRVITWVVGGIFGIARRPSPAQVVAADPSRVWAVCHHAGCREMNPWHAKFCRRCGTRVAGETPHMRYVA